MTARIVIAEDEAIIRMDLREMLEEEGYEVVGETGRGDEAVELVRNLSPELAILDIKMPGLDGLSAARHIAGERLAAVLILTAFSQHDLVEQARDAGALAYLVKPFQTSPSSRRSDTFRMGIPRSIEMRWINRKESSSERPWRSRSTPLARSTSLRVSRRSVRFLDSLASTRASFQRWTATSIAGTRSALSKGFTR